MLLAALIWGLAGVAAAQDALTVTSTTLAEVRGDNANGHDADDNYGMLRQRLYLDTLDEGLAVAIQLDGFGFLAPPDAGYRDQVLVERRFF